jgi:hypothetical protein
MGCLYGGEPARLPGQGGFAKLISPGGLLAEGAAAPPPPQFVEQTKPVEQYSLTVGQYWLIIKINGTNSVNFVGNMLSNRNFS